MLQDEDKKEAKMRRSKMLNNAEETELLSVLATDLEKRKVTLERKLLELYGLKEEKVYMAQLQRHLKKKSAEIDILNVTLGYLRDEKRSLKEETKRDFLAKQQLETAKKTLVEMQRKIDVNARNVKGKVMRIEEKVCGIQDGGTAERDALVEQKFEAANGVELEVVQMRRRNKELELEKRELSVKLLAAQVKITSLSHMTEVDI